MSSKLEWMTKTQNEIERLVEDYPKMKEEKLKLISDEYDEELRELSENMNISNKFNNTNTLILNVI